MCDKFNLPGASEKLKGHPLALPVLLLLFAVALQENQPSLRWFLSLVPELEVNNITEKGLYFGTLC